MKNEKVVKTAKDDQKKTDKANEDARIREEMIAKVYIETMRQKRAKE